LIARALLLATGAEPVRLAIPGDDLQHVCYLRTLADSRRIIDKAKSAKRTIVIGASFIGLEVAWSLRERKLEVAVVGKGSPLGKSSRARTGQFDSRNTRSEWREISSGRQPVAITDRHVQLDDETKLECDLVVIGIGVRLNTAIAEQAGIATDNGALVNEFLETNMPGIFAAGDIARWPDRRAAGSGWNIGLWRNARARPPRVIFSERGSRLSCRRFSGAIISICKFVTSVMATPKITRLCRAI
jgi:NADPH-dependent 2,4-dienoyl-CoA reductase/sulfur reductase-like enzyme